MKSETARREIESLDYYLQNHTNDYSEESHTAMMMAIDALSSSEKPNKWIPVSERLPKYDEDIIITHIGSMGQPITNVSYFDGDFRTEDGEGYFCDVIAWMPLPQPYKAESEV